MIYPLIIISTLVSLVQSSLILDFEVHQQTQQQQPWSHDNSLAKRAAATLLISNNQNIYTTNLRIGSNEEEVTLFVDTGSSDLWVMGNNVQCYSVEEFHVDGSSSLPDIFNDIDAPYTCSANGTFNPDDSTTFELSDDSFTIGYTDGSAATGRWGRDNIRLGENYTVNNLRLAIAEQSSVSDGILGIGIATGSYDNFPIALRNQGLSGKVAYSVYLNSSNATGGSILFGAIDHAKYQGSLSTVSLTSDTLLSINVTYEASNYSILMDTGSTFSILPDDWIDSFAQTVNGTYNSDEAAYEIDCSVGGSSFNFTIGSIDFAIPVEDFVVSHDDTCYLGIMGNSIVGGGILFGFDILRSLYLVYDLEEFTISVAPVIYTANEDIEELGTAVQDTAASTSSSSSSSSSTSTSSADANTLKQSQVHWYHHIIMTIVYFIL